MKVVNRLLSGDVPTTFFTHCTNLPSGLKIKARGLDKIWIKITLGKCEIWFQILKLSKKIQSNVLFPKFDYWMLKKKRENYPKKAFEQRNPDLNLILG